VGEAQQDPDEHPHLGLIVDDEDPERHRCVVQVA
jgi:hypothetical protein